VDGVEDGDHLEVGDVQASGLRNVVVPISAPQDGERREERLVAGGVHLGDVSGSG